MDQLKIGNINVNGLQGAIKRRKFFGIFKDKKLDVVMVQESHSTIENELIWQSEYGGNIFFSRGTSDSRGVMILFRRGLVYHIKDIFRDTDGRVIIIEICIDNFTYLFCNIYSPNEDKPEFFVKVAEAIETFDNRNIIWGGDFNLVLDTVLDRYQSTHNNHKSLEIVKAYMNEASLNDVWRIKNPDKKIYSWFRRRPFAMSRIDLFLISNSIMNLVSECELSVTPMSDHSLLTLTLRTTLQSRGPGLWQFNVSHLSNLQFLKELNQTVDNCINSCAQKSFSYGPLGEAKIQDH